MQASAAELAEKYEQTNQQQPALSEQITPQPQTPVAQETTQETSKIYPMQPEQMGPQPSQTAEQWVEENNKRKPESTSGLAGSENPEFASVANNEENIPGAEMYMNDNKPNLIEQTGQQPVSVKRDKIIHANFTAIK